MIGTNARQVECSSEADKRRGGVKLPQSSHALLLYGSFRNTKTHLVAFYVLQFP